MKSQNSIARRQAGKKRRRQQRRLRLELLESRELLAVDAFVVDTAVDENDGVGTGTGTSLREAIIAANADPDLTSITFDPSLNGTPISVNNGLSVSSHVTITGNGADETLLDFDNSANGFLLPGGSNVDLTVNDLHMDGGGVPTSTDGFLIFSEGAISVNRSTVSGFFIGLEASTNSGNVVVSVSDSTFTGNEYGVYLEASHYGDINASVTNSTISGNYGGVYSRLSYSYGTSGGDVVAISNTTISGHSGWGIHSYGSGNNYGAQATTTLNSTIVADNGNDIVRYGDAIVNASHSLIENNSSEINGTNVSNVTGLDPMLDPAGVQDNGGPTPTIALQPGSPAIDAGSNPLGLANDQRGAGFPREDGGTANIGAVEAILAPPDATPPTLASFVRENPAVENTDADALVFRATFDEDVMNVDAADFAVDSLSTAAITAIAQVNASTYDVTVSGGDLADFNGTVGLNLAAGQDIADLAGNSLPAGEPPTDETYTVANAPTDPGDVLQGLIDEIDQLLDDGVVSGGQANALSSKIENALKSLDKDNAGTAVNQLGALKNQINALVNSGTLSQAEADDLLEDIDLAIDLIEDL